ncbi:hypothetical protein ACTMU2_25655 [Cupriavidus basilensis]
MVLCAVHGNAVRRFAAGLARGVRPGERDARASGQLPSPVIAWLGCGARRRAGDHQHPFERPDELSYFATTVARWRASRSRASRRWCARLLLRSLGRRSRRPTTVPPEADVARPCVIYAVRRRRCRSRHARRAKPHDPMAPFGVSVHLRAHTSRPKAVAWRELMPMRCGARSPCARRRTCVRRIVHLVHLPLFPPVRRCIRWQRRCGSGLPVDAVAEVLGIALLAGVPAAWLHLDVDGAVLRARADGPAAARAAQLSALGQRRMRAADRRPFAA